MAVPEPSHTAYKYEPLAHREIRVVRLYPLTSDNQIHCEIERASIDEHPVYEALSYTWGNDTNNIPIQVGSGSVISVTENLFVALHALSPAESPRTIWIDALCINQDDLAEVSHEVSFMKDIYTRASRVFVWLGPAADNSDEVMDYIGTLDGEPDLLEHKKWVYADTSSWDWDACRPWQPLPVSSQSVDAFLCRSWFSRVWIQQEAAVNPNTVVLCGQKEVKWHQLSSLAWSYQKPSREGFAKDTLSNDGLASSLLVLNIQSYIYEDVPALLIDILRDTTFCGAKDPRDRIYAVQALAHDEDLEKLMLVPNYNESVVTVYTKLTERFLEVQGPFILCWAGRYHQDLRDLPSWVPDWTMVNNELPSINFKASGEAQAYHTVHNEDGLRILSARGVTVSSISALTDPTAIFVTYRDQMSERSIFESFRKHIDACMNLIQTQKGSSQLEDNKRALWRVLVGDNDRNWSRLPKDYGEDLDSFPAWLASFEEEQTPSKIPGAYMELIETMDIRGAFSRRRLAIDSKRHMCLVPRTTMMGDLIVIVAGLAIPLLARSSEKGRLEIIGECYVHDCMDGEAWSELASSTQDLLFC
ncbi:hypothetical protein N7491_009921 [Penicillium cf. griseofulvum]|uniref:Heterokaryon incompatibility domain-containing protein n=1 Tax=Penicillium cf. griseofulvum TaxID=2972120 RepID=A0A9W9T5B5_9EURO|nr:hypothetical protein N7472_000248 [Penicillium cf. griseofulvum]KAJ5421476.1 hypothetical protein N7491_009921 [Penicillium cf. griseofulvum]